MNETYWILFTLNYIFYHFSNFSQFSSGTRCSTCPIYRLAWEWGPLKRRWRPGFLGDCRRSSTTFGKRSNFSALQVNSSSSWHVDHCLLIWRLFEFRFADTNSIYIHKLLVCACVCVDDWVWGIGPGLSSGLGLGFRSGPRSKSESVSESRFRSGSGYTAGFLQVLVFAFAVTLDPWRLALTGALGRAA